MEWYNTLAIIFSIFGFLYYFLGRLEKDINRLEAKHDTQSARLDQLYGVIIDILKEGKK